MAGRASATGNWLDSLIGNNLNAFPVVETVFRIRLLRPRHHVFPFLFQLLRNGAFGLLRASNPIGMRAHKD